MTNSVTLLQSKDDRRREACLHEYIREAKEDAKNLDVVWTDSYWKGVGYFVKQLYAPKGSLKKAIPPEALLDPRFLDFAKAYVKERHLANPGESRSGHIKRLQTLRMLESALLECRGDASPLAIDLAVLNAAALLAKKCLRGSGPYRVGSQLQELLLVMIRRGVLPEGYSHWAHSNQQPRNNTVSVDAAADEARQRRLPDSESLDALAAIFNEDSDLNDKRSHRDVYTTSVTALLMSAPSRGQEIHRLPCNLEFRATDKFGQEQLGLRLHASKGFGAYVKWVWVEMVPVAERAIERIRAITEEARRVARHFEDPATAVRFYRHAACPEVGDDQPLTNEQICQALGYSTASTAQTVSKLGFLQSNGPWTLQRLWDEFVLPQHKQAHPHFPYVSAADKALGSKGGLKFSEALFCMLRHQLNNRSTTSPVKLWMPDLTDFTFDAGGSKTNIFARHGYLGKRGKPLKLTSHQIRHLLNTEAQRSGLTDEQIAYWSGRKHVGQNSVYDHRSTAERVEQAREVVEKVQAAVGLPSKEKGQDTSIVHGHWVIKAMAKPRSCSDIEDIQPKMTGLKTLYGECFHDWAFAPCEGFVECLDCSEHACIKRKGADAQKTIADLETLHRSVTREVGKAKLAAQGDESAKDWLDVQERYAAKIAQLISILKNDSIPDGAVIRSAQGQHPTHLQRALRGLARKALESGTEPAGAMKQMLVALDNKLEPVAEVRLAGLSQA